MSGRPAYSPALYQIQSAIAKLLVSFRCQVKIREGQAVGLRLQSVMMVDVWWCRSRTGIFFLLSSLPSAVPTMRLSQDSSRLPFCLFFFLFTTTKHLTPLTS